MDLHVSDYYYRISNSYLAAVTSKYLDPYTADDTLNSNEYKQWQVKMELARFSLMPPKSKLLNFYREF